MLGMPFEFNRYNLPEIMWAWSSATGFVSGLSYPTGMQGAGNAHEDFRAAPSLSMMFADGHAEHFPGVKGEGGRGDRFKVLPDHDW